MKEMQCREGMWRVPVSCRLKRRKPHRDAGDILAAFRMLGKGRQTSPCRAFHIKLFIQTTKFLLHLLTSLVVQASRAKICSLHKSGGQA